MDIHFGVKWFENVHNFGVMGTGICGVQNSVKYGTCRIRTIYTSALVATWHARVQDRRLYPDTCNYVSICPCVPITHCHQANIKAIECLCRCRLPEMCSQLRNVVVWRREEISGRNSNMETQLTGRLLIGTHFAASRSVIPTIPLMVARRWPFLPVGYRVHDALVVLRRLENDIL